MIPPPWSVGDNARRHSLWITHDSQFPQAIVDGALPKEVPSPYQGMSAEWAATVSQLVFADLAEITDGQVSLTKPLRLRAPGVTSRPINSLEELEWFLDVHRHDGRINTGVMEPVSEETLKAASWKPYRPTAGERSAFARPVREEPVAPAIVRKEPSTPEAPRRLADPVPEYVQTWFTDRGRYYATLQDAFEAVSLLPEEEILSFANYVARGPKNSVKALDEFWEKLPQEKTSELNHARARVVLAHANFIIETQLAQLEAKRARPLESSSAPL
jgi:hypothetical protein